MDIWLIAAAVNKGVVLLATAALMGAALVSVLQTTLTGSILYWTRAWLLALFLACLWVIPLQAGALAESGWAGMFDPIMLSIVWHTPWADSTLLRLAGASIALTAVFPALLPRAKHWQTWLLGVACLLLVMAFAWGGHLAQAPTWLQVLLCLHLAIGLTWIGSLVPFCMLTREPPTEQTARVFERFGRLAAMPLLLLVGVGALLTFSVLNAPAELIRTTYGQLLLAKIVLTLALLALGAWHKWMAVPALCRQPTVVNLQKLGTTLRLEAALGTVLLLVLSVMTSAVGPTVHV